MSTVQTIEVADLDAIKNIANQYDSITTQLGQIEVERLLLGKKLAYLDQVAESLHDEFNKTQDAETALSATMTAKYGEGVLDLNAGTITK